MADSELKVGMRGMWGDVRSEVVAVGSSLVIVRSLETGGEYGIGRELFTPDPTPPSTVKVEIDLDYLRSWASCRTSPSGAAFTDRLIEICRAALRAEGLE